MGVVVGGLVIVGIRSINRQMASPSPVHEASESSTPGKLTLWDDPAGFTFQYPQGLTIDKHDEDKDNYAHVELTDSSHPGGVIVWAKDTTAVDAVAWVRTDKQFTNATIFDTTLGETAAKKILLSTPEEKLVVGTISDSILFMIEAQLTDKEYWTSTANTIIDSFTFKPFNDDESAPGVTSEGAVEQAPDEEEVIE